MEIPEQYKHILETLVKATAEDRVLWSELTHGTAAIAFDQNTLEIWGGRDQNTEAPFISMGLRNSSGELIDNFWLDERDVGFDTLSGLHKAALRKARRIDETLARLNSELQKDLIGRQPSHTEIKKRIPSLLVGRWDHQWESGLSKRAVVTINEDGSYIAQEGTVTMHFQLENATYSEEKRQVRFDLIKVADGRKDSTQLLRVETPNLLDGEVEGSKANRRRYTRI